MQIWRRILMIGAVLALAWALPVLGDARNDPERNRRFLEQSRKDPELFARLHNEYKAFASLPSEKQERLRKFDQELNELPAPERRRLYRALERYANWLERLPEAQRRLIDSAANEDERLKVIREIRQQQWVDHLPQAFREKVQAAQGKERKDLIKSLRQKERERRQEWQLSVKHWDELLKGPPPTRKADLRPEVRQYIDKKLLPRLRRDEIERLEKASEEPWPRYLQTLVELNDKAFRIPGPVGARRLSDLPQPLRKWLNTNLSSEQLQSLKKLEGRWPEFALKLVILVRGKGKFLPPLAPAAPDQYPDADDLKWFIHSQLDRVLNDREKANLKSAEKNWPRYPLLLVFLARKHGLQIQGTTLPGAPTYWDKYRTKPEDTTLDDLIQEWAKGRRLPFLENPRKGAGSAATN